MRAKITVRKNLSPTDAAVKTGCLSAFFVDPIMKTVNDSAVITGKVTQGKMRLDSDKFKGRVDISSTDTANTIIE